MPIPSVLLNRLRSPRPRLLVYLPLYNRPLSCLRVPHISHSFIFRRKEDRHGGHGLPYIRASHFSGAAVRMYQRYIINWILYPTTRTRGWERERANERERDKVRKQRGPVEKGETAERRKATPYSPAACGPALCESSVPSRRASRRRSLDSLDDAASSTQSVHASRRPGMRPPAEV